jgi:peptidoglycan/xylan/chitin deacetylase (PgdA/CDA1 family)
MRSLVRRLGAPVRDALAEVLWRAGATLPTRRHRDRLTIVTFHRVLPDALRERYPFPGLCVTPDELRFCLAHFSAHYRCGTLAQAHGWRRRGARDARPPLALTFDDATRDNHAYAAPVLAEHGLHATFFVPVDAVSTGLALWHDRVGFALAARGRDDFAAVVESLKAAPPSERARFVEDVDAEARSVPEWAGMMGWAEVRALGAGGHEIGSHSMSHPLLPQCAREQKRHELLASKHALEEATGGAVTSLAYPNGDYDDETVDVAAAAGYALAVTTRWGTNGRSAHPLALRRCDMDARRMRSTRGSLSQARLAWRMSGLYPV